MGEFGCVRIEAARKILSKIGVVAEGLAVSTEFPNIMGEGADVIVIILDFEDL